MTQRVWATGELDDDARRNLPCDHAERGREARSVGTLAFDQIEVLDFAGPYEVFNVAGDLSTPPGMFHVVTVGVTSEPIGGGGFCVRPNHLLQDATHLI